MKSPKESRSREFLYFPESKTIGGSKHLIGAIDSFLWHLGAAEMTAQSLAERMNADPNEIASILNQYCVAEVLSTRAGKPCPNSDCLIGVIWEDDFQNEECPECHKQLTDEWRALPPERHYEIYRSGRAFSPWMILIHGMNTTGDWQQHIAFIQGLMGENSPFLIYKYGLKRIEPFFEFLQSWRTRQFLCDYHNARTLARNNGIDESPDAIAHSFGTLIIGRALRSDPTVEFGKILLCGSILPPNFEWSKYLDEGRVQSVLNHFGGKDFWARIAVRAIPNTGPSGRVGLVESTSHADRLFNVRSPNYRHSDFFEERFFDNQFKTLWRPYFWGKLEELGGAINLKAGLSDWKKPAFYLRAPFLTWVFLLILLFGIMRGGQRLFHFLFN